ncbi:TLC domain-containing protein 1, partial [Fasciolopsis buskii]
YPDSIHNSISGYFIHDIYHNYCSGICLRSAEIILHHITVVICLSIVITYRVLLPYALIGLLMELNSIFLHGRQIMLYLDVNPNSLVYRMNANANVGSFIVFRILLTIGLDYWAVSNRHRLPGAISAVLIFSFIVFTVMNFVLFFRVLASEKRILNEYNKRHMTNQPYSNGTVSCWDSSVKKTKTK